jgi:hypothetical protein
MLKSFFDFPYEANVYNGLALIDIPHVLNRYGTIEDDFEFRSRKTPGIGASQ